MNKINNKDLKYISPTPIRPIKDKEILIHRRRNVGRKKSFESFDDWLVLGIIIISVGLFMRFKERI